MYYHFFFDYLYNILDVQQAFKAICFDKMLFDGYFDIGVYIYGRIKKQNMYTRLALVKSKYAILYRGSYPTQDTAVKVWQQAVGKSEYQITDNSCNCSLSTDESIAIVNWVYRIFNNSQEREQFTKELFKHLKELNRIQNNIRFSKGIVYNLSKVEIHFLSSVLEVDDFFLPKNPLGTNSFIAGMQSTSEISPAGGCTVLAILLARVGVQLWGMAASTGARKKQ